MPETRSPLARLNGAANLANFRAYADVATWVQAAVVDIVAALQRDVAAEGHARLLLSGGTTPAPVYRELSKAHIDWSKVDVGLVDERWLPVNDPDSNARLICETLLQNQASAANFQPLIRVGDGIESSLLHSNPQSRSVSVAVLGMGPDGHTASLFPDMPGLPEALASDQDYVLVNARGCAGAGPWPDRISLTPAGLAKARCRVLLIRGEQKRELFHRALTGDDANELPVRIALNLPGAPLQTYWCP